jgi:hypothetical protein
MANGKSPKSSVTRRYEVDANYASIRTGDSFASETYIGKDRRTGKLINAERDGKVVAVSFNPISNSFVVTVDEFDFLG